MHHLWGLSSFTALLMLLGLGEPAFTEAQPLALADDPFEITDPVAAKPGEAELNLVGLYERARSGAHRGTIAFDTELQMGIARGLEIRVGQVDAYGNVELRGRPAMLEAMQPVRSQSTGVPASGGATRVEAPYQFTNGSGAFPITSVLGRVRAVYGRDIPGYEGDLFALFAQTIGSGPRAMGLNLNLGWTSRFNPVRGERPSRYSISATIGQGIADDTVLVLGYVRRQQERGERDFSLVEVGLRQRFPGGGPILGLAAGFGTNRDSPAFRVSLAAQWSFGGDAR